MEITTYNQCTCANCGHLIDYRASRAGEIVECPRCGEKSRLPEVKKLDIIEAQGPPIPLSKTCAVCGHEMRFLEKSCPNCDLVRKHRIHVAILLSCTLVVAVLVVLTIVKPFRTSGFAGESSNSVTAADGSAQPATPKGYIMIEQPRPRMPKSTNDLRVGKFTLEKRRGSDLIIAVGDIQNDSDNVHTGLRADLDLLDQYGVKIGTASDYFSELGPHENWHFLVNITKTNAFTVRFVSIKED